MAPDVLPLFLNRTVYTPGAPRWCIVRNPMERWASCLTWRRGPNLTFPSGTWFGRASTPPEKLLRVLSAGRGQIAWTEELAHLQPQSWFVWDGLGCVQCECVVAFEQLPFLTSRTVRNSAHASGASVGIEQYEQLPPPLRLLYALDLYLWQLAWQLVNTSQFCYRPLPAPPDL